MTQSHLTTNGIASVGENGESAFEEDPDQVLIPRSLNEDVRLWSVDDIGRWLRLSGYEDFVG
jgi:hypothetical protein